MKATTLDAVTLAVQHWMLMTAIFAMGSFAVDGEVAILYTAFAWVISMPLIIFYPVLLRLLALLRRPRLGLAALLVVLMVANDWLFHKMSAPGSTSSDFPLHDSFSGDEVLPIRLCVQGAMVLSTAALWLPITDHLRSRGGTGAPRLTQESDDIL